MKNDCKDFPLVFSDIYTDIYTDIFSDIHRISQPYLKYYGRELAETAVSGWLESPVHRENLLNEESAYVGVGIAKGKNDNGESAWYCVQLFMVNGGEITWVDDPIR